ncbi:hypothetical protein LY15_004424 [Prauserella flava]|nr:hypothetical protein [Prauserella flava]MCR3736865.1 hypothetical protein [Prauserella salsuginis]
MRTGNGVGLGTRSRVRQSWRMKHFPFPVRVAAGLAASTADTVRDLPKHLTELPVTVASQVLQTSMRVQQHVTELAIKGDDALAAFRGVDDEPNWATFDEDDDPAAAQAEAQPGSGAQHGSEAQRGAEAPGAAATFDDPWDAESQALGEAHEDGEFDSTDPRIAAPVTDAAPTGGTTTAGGADAATAAGPTASGAPLGSSVVTGSTSAPSATAGPAGVDDYDALSLPELRSRLRSFSSEELQQLLDYERDHENRPSFTGMLTRRIANVRAESEAAADSAAEGSSDGGAGDGTDDAATGETTTS